MQSKEIALIPYDNVTFEREITGSKGAFSNIYGGKYTLSSGEEVQCAIKQLNISVYKYYYPDYTKLCKVILQEIFIMANFRKPYFLNCYGLSLDRDFLILEELC